MITSLQLSEPKSLLETRLGVPPNRSGQRDRKESFWYCVKSKHCISSHKLNSIITVLSQLRINLNIEKNYKNVIVNINTLMNE